MKKESLKLKKPVMPLETGNYDSEDDDVIVFAGIFYAAALGIGITAFVKGSLTLGVISAIMVVAVPIFWALPKILAKSAGLDFVETGPRGRAQINQINSLAYSLEAAAVNLRRGDSTNVDEAFDISQTLINEAVVLVKSLSTSISEDLHFNAVHPCNCPACVKAVESIRTIKSALASAVTAVSRIAEETRNLSRAQIGSLEKVTKRLGDEANHISEARKELASL